jgi:hypothetical protein
VLSKTTIDSFEFANFADIWYLHGSGAGKQTRHFLVQRPRALLTGITIGLSHSFGGGTR